VTNSFWVWIGTMFSFIGFLILMAYSKDKWSGLETRFFFTNIGLGVIAFIMMAAFSMFKERDSKKHKKSKKTKF